ASGERGGEPTPPPPPNPAARGNPRGPGRRGRLGTPAVFRATTAPRRHADRFDPLIARQINILYDAFAPHQVPADLRQRLVELEVAVETTFNTFRGEMDGRRVDDNAIAEGLRTSADSRERRAGGGGPPHGGAPGARPAPW